MRARGIIAIATVAALVFMLTAMPVFAQGPSGSASGPGEPTQTQTQAQATAPQSGDGPQEPVGEGEPASVREQTREQDCEQTCEQSGATGQGEECDGCGTGPAAGEQSRERAREQVRTNENDDPAGTASRTRATVRNDGSEDASGTSTPDTSTVSADGSVDATASPGGAADATQARQTFMHRFVRALPEGLTAWFRVMLRFFGVAPA